MADVDFVELDLKKAFDRSGVLWKSRVEDEDDLAICLRPDETGNGLRRTKAIVLQNGGGIDRDENEDRRKKDDRLD